MAVCVGNVHTNDGFFDVTLFVRQQAWGAWGAALLNLELYDLHVRPLIARAAAKQRAAGGTARDAVVRPRRSSRRRCARPAPHWDVLLRWASSIEPSSLGTVGLESGGSGSGPGDSADVHRHGDQRPPAGPSSQVLLSPAHAGGAQYDYAAG